MSGYGLGPYGGGPYGIGGTSFGKVINFRARTDYPNVISLNWDFPDNYNVSTQDIIILRTKTHYPIEITDPVAVEVYRGDTQFNNDVQPLFDIDGLLESTSTNIGDDFIEDTTQNFSSLVGPTKTLGDLTGCIVENNNSIFVVTRNTTTTLYLKPSNVNPALVPQSGTYKLGIGLEDDTFYYYTAFTDTGNPAKAIFGSLGSQFSTQVIGLSAKNQNYGDKIYYELLPEVYRAEDTTGDFKDFIEVLANEFNINHSLVSSFTLTNPSRMKDSVLIHSNNTLGYKFDESNIGVDTLRRISQNIVEAWMLKGSRDGIALFIRIITTWCLEDPINQIFDNIGAGNFLQTYSPVIAGSDIHIFDTNDNSGARLLKKLPVVLPIAVGRRAYLVSIPDVAIHAGLSTGVTSNSLEDTNNTFSSDLSGNFLFPSDSEPGEFYKIKSNTLDTITVEDGKTILNVTPGNNYFVLSPLNTQRYLRLQKLIRFYEPYFAYGFITFT